MMPTKLAKKRAPTEPSHRAQANPKPGDSASTKACAARTMPQAAQLCACACSYRCGAIMPLTTPWLPITGTGTPLAMGSNPGCPMTGAGSIPAAPSRPPCFLAHVCRGTCVLRHSQVTGSINVCAKVSPICCKQPMLPRRGHAIHL